MKSYYYIDTGENPAIDDVGGKGLSLIRSYKKGYPVPQGIILTTDFFYPWISYIKTREEWKSLITDDDKNRAERIKQIKKMCHDLPFSDIQLTTMAELHTFIDKKNIESMAVRSSSPEEDRENASFAGIYESILGVKKGHLEIEVRNCFASVFGERVFSYKNEHGFDPFDPKIAVIIQKQIDSEVAGVAFSINPVNNCYDEVIINANFGLGETVVDGSITPDQWIVDGVRKRILNKTAGTKHTAKFLNHQGGTIKKTPEKPDDFCLTEQQVLEITELINKIDADYNKPMDIEWAYEKNTLYLLQARPITGYELFPPELITEPGEQKRLYIDALLTEQGFIENMSPFGVGIFQIFTKVSFGGNNKLSGAEKLFCIAGGRLYSNIGTLTKLSGRKAAIASFNSVDAMASKILDGLDLKDFVPRKTPKGLFSSVFGMSFKYIKSLPNTIKAFNKPEKYLAYFLDANRQLEHDMKRTFDESHPLGIFCETIMTQMMDWMLKISLPTLYAALIARSRIKKMFKKEEKDIQDTLIFLEQAFPNNVTIEMGLRLFELSCFSEIHDSSDTDDFLDKLNNRRFSTEFLEKWDLFMTQYGFRCPKELDIATPRYYERPEDIFSLLKNMETFHDENQTPQALFERGGKKREETLELLLGRLKSKGKQKKFMKYYTILKSFTAYREIHKYYMIMGFDIIRRKMLILAEEWVKAGRLDRTEQIFNLTYDQVLTGEYDKNMELGPLIEHNQSYFSQFNKNNNPPAIFDSRGTIYRLSQEGVAENELIGTPASPGIAMGPVKVLTKPDEKPILPGDILVARATDPGWTTLFLNAAGVLIENGGTLQHGASVARESCKPCIVGVAEITSILKDGQIVEFDGATGIIRILE